MSGYISGGNDSFSASFSEPSYSDQSVTIGDFVLDGWEVPEQVSWGGAQQMTVHKFVGGTRYIDVMGFDNKDVSWSGRFLSPDAAFRADQLDQMRKAGAPVELIFAGRYYIAVISSFSADQVMQWHVPYQISLTILSDNSAVAPPSVPPLSAVTYDIAAANALALAPLLAPAQAAVAVIPALLVPMATIAAGAAATATLAAAVTSAAALVATAQTAADNQIRAIAASEVIVANLAGANTVVGAVANMQAALAATYASASAVALSGYVNRASTNIANA